MNYDQPVRREHLFITSFFLNIKVNIDISLPAADCFQETRGVHFDVDLQDPAELERLDNGLLHDDEGITSLEMHIIYLIYFVNVIIHFTLG